MCSAGQGRRQQLQAQPQGSAAGRQFTLTSLRVKALPLALQVDHNIEGVRICQAACHILPAQGVALQVRVDLTVPQVLQAPLQCVQGGGVSGRARVRQAMRHSKRLQGVLRAAFA